MNILLVEDQDDSRKTLSRLIGMRGHKVTQVATAEEAERQIRDLTERNQARIALQQSARTLTDILENTTDGFFALDYAWRFTYVNPEAESLFGRSRKELLGGELWQKFPELRGTPFEQNYRQVMA